MKISPSLRRLFPWIGAILLSVTVALGIIEVTRLSLDQAYPHLGNCQFTGCPAPPLSPTFF